MKRTIFKVLALAVLLLGLPLTGVVAFGRRLSVYLQFPPLTQVVEHAGFSPVMFALVAFADLLIFVPVVLFVWRGWSEVHGGEPPARSARPAFPWWGWAGLLLTIGSWAFAWTRFSFFAPLQPHTFTPLWLGYILVVNGLSFRRNGRSLLVHRPGLFVALFPASAFFWWFFEYLNRFVQNWHYTAVADFNSVEYVIFASVSFSTVLPAVIGTRDLLLTFPTFSDGLRDRLSLPLPEKRLPAALMLLLSGGGLAAIGVFPDLLFGLLWLSPLLIALALEVLLGERTLLAPARRGDWRLVVVSAVSALICGFFWEMWNMWSLSRWEYRIPYVARFHIFEMPLLGYAGYLPFGLECAVVFRWIRRCFGDKE